jgi:hypothetical protein
MSPRTHPAGRSRLDDRLGRQPEFLERMITRLSDPGLPALADLTTREPSDPSIALLDAFACVADVITFYRERLLNEGYLGTATERRALAGLAALVGYQPRPGVAAATALALTMEKDARARLDAGLRTQSVPGPGEQAQTFETSDDIEARFDYNELVPRTTKPQVITLDNALVIDEVVVQGTTLGLRPGDVLLLYFAADAGSQVVRVVESVDIDHAAESTVVALVPVHDRLVQLFERLRMDAVGGVEKVKRLLDDVALGEPPDSLLEWVRDDQDLSTYSGELESALEVEVRPEPVVDAKTIESIVAELASTSLRTPGSRPDRLRAVATTQASAASSSLALDVLAKLRGADRSRVFRAWASAGTSRTNREVEAVFVLRRIVGLFGQNAPTARDEHGAEVVLPASSDEGEDRLFVDGAIPELQSFSHVVIRKPIRLDADDHDRFERIHRFVSTAASITRSAYGIAGPATRLTVHKWIDKPPSAGVHMALLRRVTVYGGSERLTLVEVRDPSPVGACSTPANEVRLDRLVEGLEPGRVVAIAGKQREWDDDLHPDPTEATGPPVAELATISVVSHGSPPERRGAAVATTLVFTRDLQHCYRRDTVKINANVVEATQGETRGEVLGGGDATQPHQRFALKQWPLTFVPADTADGIDSTLEVRVDDLRWHESTPGEEPDASARVYRTQRLDDGKAAVVFGDGARPRTAPQNIEARYRVGIGRGGNVDEGTITTLVTRPLGVKAVVNPIPATGGAGPDDAGEIRERAPSATEALDRLVGVADYAAFALAFAGIAKADAVALPVGGAETVVVTVAARDDAPIDRHTAVLARLADALRRYGDPIVAVRVLPRERMAFVLRAGLRIQSDARWSDVERAVRSRLLDRFGAARRALGQDLSLATVVECIQRTPGVEYVDVDAFGGIGPIVGLTVSEIEAQLENVPAGADIEPFLPVRGAFVVGPNDVPKGRIAGDLVAATLGTFFPDLPQTLQLTEIRDGR